MFPLSGSAQSHFEPPQSEPPLGSFRSLHGDVLVRPSHRAFAVGWAAGVSEADRYALVGRVVGADFDVRVRAEARGEWLVERSHPWKSTAEQDDALRALSEHDEVEWALQAGRLPNGALLGVTAEVLVVGGAPIAGRGSGSRSVSEAHRVRWLSALPGAAGGRYAVELDSGGRLRASDVFAAARAIGGRVGVDDAHPNFLREKRPRYVPNDPYLSQQWYLGPIKALDAWDVSFGAATVVVAIIDDGFDLTHPELAGAGKIVSPYDFNGDDANPSPGPDDVHGTSVAGIALANGDNGQGIAGVCPQCRLMPIRQGFSDFDDVAAFDYVASHGAHVVNNSWGYYYPSTSVKNAIAAASINGRGGLGTLVLFASGNEGVSIDLYQDISASPGAVAVGAATSSDGYSGYSNFGASLDLSAPADGQLTTDVVNGGYAAGAYTGSFGGTSGACPVAAGVAGLAFSVAPDASEAAVRGALYATADKIGGGYDAQGKSAHFGYGRVNAAAAVGYVAAYVAETGGGAGAGGETAGGETAGGETAGGETAGGEAGGGGTTEPDAPLPSGTCAEFLDCLAGCQSDGCVAACADATHPEALAAANLLVACLADNGCYDVGAVEFPSCAEGQCGAPAHACFGDAGFPRVEQPVVEGERGGEQGSSEQGGPTPDAPPAEPSNRSGSDSGTGESGTEDSGAGDSGAGDSGAGDAATPGTSDGSPDAIAAGGPGGSGPTTGSGDPGLDGDFRSSAGCEAAPGAHSGGPWAWALWLLALGARARRRQSGRFLRR